METENITLKPIPPKIINCSACKKTFDNNDILKEAAQFYKVL